MAGLWILVGLLLETTLASQCTGSWTTVLPEGSKPPHRMSSSVVFSTEDLAFYVFGGYGALANHNTDNYLFRLSVQSGRWRWTDLTDESSGTPPLPRHDSGFACAGGKLYVFGGIGIRDYAYFYNDFHVYDISRQTWSDLTNQVRGASPTTGTHHFLAPWQNKLYLLTGLNGRALDPQSFLPLHQYDITSRTWTDLMRTSRGSAPTVRHQFGAALVDGKLFVGGGYLVDQGYMHSEFYEFDIAARTWTALTFGGLGRGRSRYAGMQGHVYHLNAPFLYEYQPSTQTWANLSSSAAGSMPPRQAFTYFSASRDRLYVLLLAGDGDAAFEYALRVCADNATLHSCQAGRPTCQCTAGFAGEGLLHAGGCGECEAPVFSAERGHTECQPCNPCEAGYFRAGCGRASAGTCSACPPQTYKPSAGAGACEPCQGCGPGEFRRGCGGAQRGQCEVCGEGSFKAIGGPGDCAPCATCDDGFFRNGCGGAAAGSCYECAACEAGQYRTGCGPGASGGQCEGCPPCAAGQVREGCGGQSHGFCVQCPEGKFKLEAAGSRAHWHAECVPCGPCAGGTVRVGCTAADGGRCGEAETWFFSTTLTMSADEFSPRVKRRYRDAVATATHVDTSMVLVGTVAEHVMPQAGVSISVETVVLTARDEVVLSDISERVGAELSLRGIIMTSATRPRTQAGDVAGLLHLSLKSQMPDVTRFATAETLDIKLALSSFFEYSDPDALSVSVIVTARTPNADSAWVSTLHAGDEVVLTGVPQVGRWDVLVVVATSAKSVTGQFVLTILQPPPETQGLGFDSSEFHDTLLGQVVLAVTVPLALYLVGFVGKQLLRRVCFEVASGEGTENSDAADAEAVL